MKNEEKAKIGRPKLADKETKGKAIKLLLVCATLLICLTVGGAVALFGINNTSKLAGAAKKPNEKLTDSYGNSIFLYENPKPDSIAVQWSAGYKFEITSLYIYSANSSCSITNNNALSKVSTFSSNTNKRGSYRFGVGGKSTTIKPNSYYIASATFKSWTKKSIVNFCIKTSGPTTTKKTTTKAKNKAEIVNVKDTSFEIHWTGCPTSFTVYYSNSSKDTLGKVGTELIGYCNSGWKVDTNDKNQPWKGLIKKDTYYKVGVKFSSNNIQEFHFKTTGGKTTKPTTKAPSKGTYGITFIPNNGSSETKYQEIKYGVATALAKNTFKFGNKKFEGWMVVRTNKNKIQYAVNEKGKTTWVENANGKKYQIYTDGVKVAETAAPGENVYMVAKWTNNEDKFIVNSFNNNECHAITAPKGTTYWRIGTFYKKQSSGSFGSNKIAALNENHYKDGQTARVICFSRQKYDDESYRLMVKKTKNTNDSPSGSVSSWKPNGWKANNGIGWAYKDFNINW